MVFTVEHNYRNESNNSNNFISGVRILWNTVINHFSQERGVFELLVEIRSIMTQVTQTH